MACFVSFLYQFTIFVSISNELCISWTFGPNWPDSGEIDIIEGVNDQATNFMTIHSGNSACKMESKGISTLEPYSTDCYYQTNGNEGCSYHDTDKTSYGSGFNQAQGGVFAMEYTGDTVSIWKWNNGASPSDVLSNNPNPSNWGPPRAQWHSTANGGCDLKTAIRNQNIVFDTTFCGDWAGAIFPGSSGSGSAYPNTCSDFVKHNPSSFSDAFWQIRSLKVYTPNGQATGTSPQPQSTSTTALVPTTEAPPPPPPAQTSTTIATSTTSEVILTTTSDVAIITPSSITSTSTVSSDTLPASPTTDSTVSFSSTMIPQESTLSAAPSISTEASILSSFFASSISTESISSTISTDSLPSSSSSLSMPTETVPQTTSTESTYSSSITTSSSTATPATTQSERGSCSGYSSENLPYPTAVPTPTNSTTTHSIAPSGYMNSHGPSYGLSSTPVAPSKTVQTNSPWSVVVNQDGIISEVQEPQADIEQNISPRKYYRHGHHFRARA